MNDSHQRLEKERSVTVFPFDLMTSKKSCYWNWPPEHFSHVGPNIFHYSFILNKSQGTLIQDALNFLPISLIPTWSLSKKFTMSTIQPGLKPSLVTSKLKLCHFGVEIAKVFVAEKGTRG